MEKIKELKELSFTNEQIVEMMKQPVKSEPVQESSVEEIMNKQAENGPSFMRRLKFAEGVLVAH